MAVTINADTSNGLVMTPDTSGEIKLQSAGTDTVTVNSSGKILAATGSGWVGTVAESSTSSIIEQGSNANGNYVKYADGTMICNNILSAATSSTWTFPVVFSSAPMVQATNAAGNSSRFCSIGTPSTTSVAVYRWTYQGTVSTTIAHVLAIGFWY